jgi:hypothetical protein
MCEVLVNGRVVPASGGKLVEACSSRLGMNKL